MVCFARIVFFGPESKCARVVYVFNSRHCFAPRDTYGRGQLRRITQSDTRKVDYMEEKDTSPRGLCKSCDHMPECIYYAKKPGRHVVHCDEYSCQISPAAMPSVKRVGLPEYVRSSMQVSETVEPGQPLGLCRSCKHFGSCTFHRPEGGVWHCLEYE